MSDKDAAQRQFPALSVLMPVYNAERYIAAAIESILAQSFSDFEFLILDDGSSDGSAAIVQDFADRDPRIRFWSRENRGISATLNEMAAAARAPWLARMDADDVSYPDRFERQLAYLATHPDVDVLGSWVIFSDEDMRPIMAAPFPEDHSGVDLRNLKGDTGFCHPSVVMRRASLAAVGGYQPDCDGAEDLDLWLRMAEHGTRLANLQEVLLDYRANTASISGRDVSRQAKIAARVCKMAWERRGLPEQTLVDGKWRPGTDRASQRDFALKWGWQAWGQGYQATARHMFLKAVRVAPFSAASWNGLIFGTLRRPPARPDRTD